MTTNTVANSPEMDNQEETAPTSDMIVLDIGKQDSDSLKKLRKGKGKLLRKVTNTVEQLRDAKKINPNAQIILVVAREKNAGIFDLLD